MKSIKIIVFCVVTSPLLFGQAGQLPHQLNYQGRISVQGVNYTGPGLFKFALLGAEENISSQASARAVIGGLGDGLGPRVLSITVLNGGSGYTTVPAVTITHPTGNGAAATAVVTDGVVTSIEVTAKGLGYNFPDAATVVTIDAPPATFQRPTRWSNDNTSVMGSEPTAAVELPVTQGLYSVALGDAALPNMAPFSENLFANHGELYLRVWFDDGVNGPKLLTPDQRLLAAPYALSAAAVPDGSISSAKIAAGAISSGHLAPGAVLSGNLAPAVITSASLDTGGTAPAAGQVLGYTTNGLRWVNGGGAAFTLPQPFQALNTNASLFDLENTNGTVLSATSLGNTAVDGRTFASGASGIYGEAVNQGAQIAYGVHGHGGFNASGVYGSSNEQDGIVGETFAGGKSGVSGKGIGGHGVSGTSGVIHHSGVYGISTHPSGIGGTFVNTNPSGVGLEAIGRTNLYGWLYVHDTDFLIGSPSRRGSPGRAVVDWRATRDAPTQLYLNFGDDWQETKIGGAVTEVKALRITGGADLAEPFAMSHENVEPGSVVVIDEAHPGKLRMSDAAYDKKVAGIVSGADGIKPGISMIQEDLLEAGENVALSGRVYVKANNSAGAIRPGDLLTTSAIPGEAMKATDHERAQGAIIGKAMTSLSEASGKVLVLVTLQ